MKWKRRSPLVFSEWGGRWKGWGNTHCISIAVCQNLLLGPSKRSFPNARIQRFLYIFTHRSVVAKRGFSGMSDLKTFENFNDDAKSLSLKERLTSVNTIGKISGRRRKKSSCSQQTLVSSKKNNLISSPDRGLTHGASIAVRLIRITEKCDF